MIEIRVLQGRVRRVVTNLVKVYLDAAHVRRTDGNHAEEAVSPSTKERNALVEDEQVLEPLRHVRRHREQFA